MAGTGQPIMFTTGATAQVASSAVKAKNNQPTQKMFYPQSKDGKPPHPMLSSKLNNSGYSQPAPFNNR